MNSPATTIDRTAGGPAGTGALGPVSALDFGNALRSALRDQAAELRRIAAGPSPPDFDNTIVALEASGLELDRLASVFFNRVGTDGDEALQALEREMAPELARHRTAILLDPDLFARIERLWGERASLPLSAEQQRVLERHHTQCIRAGAALGNPAKERLAAIMERLAALGTEFSQNLLAAEREFALELAGDADLAGLPLAVRDAAARAAADRGMPGRHIVTLLRSSVEPVLQFSTRRDLREKVFRAWIARGEGSGATDNRPVVAEILRLRDERAKLLGYPNFAAFRLSDMMAATPVAARALLDLLWRPAVRDARRDAKDLETLAAADGVAGLAAWDWRFYAERLRRERFDVGDGELRPYLQLDRMIEAAFYVAGRLFGLTFAARNDIVLYHPDVRAWDVRDASGRTLGLFLGDYFARPSKRSGAWMSALQAQHRLGAGGAPIVLNVMNFAKPSAGAPALLGFEEAQTLFHEFGHALHGLLSDVTYPLISGTHVAPDFVEFPSQLYERWLEQAEVLSLFARHCDTDAPMPKDMLKRFLAARSSHQGFVMLEYLASAIVDLELHQAVIGDGFDPIAFERDSLERIGMPPAIGMRHRVPQFHHAFADEGYAAGYYAYIWSEVLDADGFAAFKEAGDIFDQAIAAKLREHIYAAGGRRSPDDAYLAFRGRMPSPEALLRRRGLHQIGDAKSWAAGGS